ncbi:hypothetical protein LPU83_pLPU83d_0680 (plasmid) [Rhizobium favelukesii]|uniref:Uncharacterized protein n=1 Tax=Rhizobium favelukesii TaxID=348824 RepID=W6RPF6_9HYPH|nr:hypothetical protein LPU83_pLPU83d_0680 [Rhizobium favelukesii]
MLGLHPSRRTSNCSVWWVAKPALANPFDQCGLPCVNGGSIPNALQNHLKFLQASPEINSFLSVVIRWQLGDCPRLPC